MTFVILDAHFCKKFYWREEKRKRKKNKRVYDALQRINEASDERDSVSLKSRESGSNGQTPNSAVGSTISYSESPYVSRQPMLSNIISGKYYTWLLLILPNWGRKSTFDLFVK